MDSKSIQHALAQGGKEAEYKLIHVVESAGFLFGKEVDDYESQSDTKHLHAYVQR